MIIVFLVFIIRERYLEELITVVKRVKNHQLIGDWVQLSNGKFKRISIINRL